MVQPARLAVTLACRVNEGEAARLTHAIGLHAPEKPLLEGNRDRLREPNADKTAGRDRVTGADQAHRLRRGPDLARGVVRHLQGRSGIRVHVSPRSEKEDAATQHWTNTADAMPSHGSSASPAGASTHAGSGRVPAMAIRSTRRSRFPLPWRAYREPVSNPTATLVRHWSNTGPTLFQHWPNTGRTLAQRWPNTPTLA